MTDPVQLRLPAPQVLDIESVRRQRSMTKAIALCAELGGFQNDKDCARHLGIDPPVWTRIKQGEANFPHDRFEQLFDETGNEAPLIWLADRRGYVLTPKETEMERRLRAKEEQLREVEAENKVLRSLFPGAKP